MLPGWFITEGANTTWPEKSKGEKNPTIGPFARTKKTLFHFAAEKKTKTFRIVSVRLCTNHFSPGIVEPDQVYKGITFDDFLKIREGIDIETKMHVRFLTLEPMALCY
ncbi:uncharacterized protein M6D78_015559 isoform 1-T1 [Vipera latastei]